MKVGDLVKVHPIVTGFSAPMPRIPGDRVALVVVGLVVDTDRHDNPVLSVDGVIKTYHRSYVEVVINEA